MSSTDLHHGLRADDSTQVLTQEICLGSTSSCAADTPLCRAFAIYASRNAGILDDLSRPRDLAMPWRDTIDAHSVVDISIRHERH